MKYSTIKIWQNSLLIVGCFAKLQQKHIMDSIDVVLLVDHGAWELLSRQQGFAFPLKISNNHIKMSYLKRTDMGTRAFIVGKPLKKTDKCTGLVYWHQKIQVYHLQSLYKSSLSRFLSTHCILKSSTCFIQATFFKLLPLLITT